MDGLDDARQITDGWWLLDRTTRPNAVRAVCAALGAEPVAMTVTSACSPWTAGVAGPGRRVDGIPQGGPVAALVTSARAAGPSVSLPVPVPVPVPLSVPVPVSSLLRAPSLSSGWGASLFVSPAGPTPSNTGARCTGVSPTQRMTVCWTGVRHV